MSLNYLNEFVTIKGISLEKQHFAFSLFIKRKEKVGQTLIQHESFIKNSFTEKKEENLVEIEFSTRIKMQTKENKVSRFERVE